jgi:hypothetical protein
VDVSGCLRRVEVEHLGNCDGGVALDPWASASCLVFRGCPGLFEAALPCCIGCDDVEAGAVLVEDPVVESVHDLREAFASVLAAERVGVVRCCEAKKVLGDAEKRLDLAIRCAKILSQDEACKHDLLARSRTPHAVPVLPRRKVVDQVPDAVQEQLGLLRQQGIISTPTHGPNCLRERPRVEHGLARKVEDRGREYGICGDSMHDAIRPNSCMESPHFTPFICFIPQQPLGV